MKASSPILASRFYSVFLGINLGLAGLAHGATLSVSPSTISNTYNGYITLTIGGLTNGETVVIEKFADANTNGVIDAGDFLLQSFRLTDGVSSTIGGVTNINVPGDANPAASNIIAQVNYSAPQPDHIVGKYEFKLSSPGGRFTPVTNLFTVTNFAFAQSFTGAIKNSGTNVPNAVIVLFTGTQGQFAGGTLADNSGNYSMKVPPGTYQLLAFKSNFVADFPTAPTLTLSAGATLATNVTMLSATRSISGNLSDSAAPSTALPGVLLFAQSTNFQAALGWTDTNGNYTVRVTASQWKLKPGDPDLAFHGYLRPQNSTKAVTTSGDVSGVNFALPKGNSLFYGTIRDDLNNPLVGIGILHKTTSASTTRKAGATSTAFSRL